MIRSRPLVFLPVLPFKKGSIEEEAMLAQVRRSHNGVRRWKKLLLSLSSELEEVRRCQRTASAPTGVLKRLGIRDAALKRHIKLNSFNNNNDNNNTLKLKPWTASFPIFVFLSQVLYRSSRRSKPMFTFSFSYNFISVLYDYGFFLKGTTLQSVGSSNLSICPL